ncbi:MAG: FtsX-like permease family protein, partial [Cyclobacteriaceae bacterium]
LIDNVAFVDSTFLDIFDFELIAGDRETALHHPYSLVATESTIEKFYPDQAADVLGKFLKYRDKEYKITGILKDIPENSHLQFDALVSMSTVTSENPNFNNQSGSNFLNTYLVIQPEAIIPAIEKRFPEFMIRYTGNEEVNDYYTLFLQPLAEVHLASTDIEHDYNNYRKFNGEYLEIFSIVGFFILLIAAVNFMNLTTSRASHRWKEIGVRKSAGAKKMQLFGQFIFESIILALVALVLALALDVLFIPILNQLVGRQLNILPELQNPMKILIVVGVALTLGFFTGIYPAFYMTSKKLTTALKGNKSSGGSIFRNSLVVIQFGLALAMIVSTLIVIQQLSYMKNKDIGFDKSQMLLVSMNKEANQKFETLKTELLRSSYVSGVTASGQRLGNNFHQWRSE